MAVARKWLNSYHVVTPTDTNATVAQQQGMLYKDYDRKGSVEKKISGREPQGSWHQDKLIGGKPPVAK
jgi:hypothetical protein